MYLSKWKNLIITFLVFLAIYQTTGLWFENFSTNSLFYLIKNREDKARIQKDTMYLTESILINTGNNKFIRKYNNISNSDYKKIFDDAINICLEKGDFSYIKNFNIDEILNRKAVIYTYDFMFKGEDIPKIFNFKNSQLLKIDEFDTLIIMPILDGKYNLKTVFLSSKTLQAYELKVSRYNLSQNIINTINDFNNLEQKDFYYVSTQENGISLFKHNQFLIKAREDVFSINNIFATNPLEQDGGILLSESEKYVDIFFENPITKASSFINNTYTYNDENVIVKYYPNGLLEYIKYKGSTEDRKYSAYNVALQFLSKDTNIKNEYYLSNYKIEENKVKFYFNYKINNLPILLSKEKMEETDMESMIEITVEDNIVSKYKRIVYDFSILEETTLVEQSFIDAIDNLILNLDTNVKYIDEMKLCYRFNNIEDTICLRWLINTNDTIYYEDVLYGG